MSLAWLISRPVIVPAKGRVIRLINMRETVPTGKPSVATPKKVINDRYYADNRERLLEKQRARRAAAKDAYVRRNSRSLPAVPAED